MNTNTKHSRTCVARSLRFALAVVAASTLFGATPSLAYSRDAAPDATKSTTKAFFTSLSACRFQHGGPTSQRVHLPAEHPAIAACLRERGWNTNGTRTAR